MLKKLRTRFGRWVFRTLAFIGMMTILFNFGMYFLVYKATSKKTDIPEQIVLNITLDGELANMPVNSPLAKLFGDETQDLFTLTNIIRRAAEDERVYGIIADISNASIPSANAKDIHDALTVFRKSGKFSIAYADTFSEGGNALSQYYLASGFDEIWMQPSGTLFLVGIASETPFLKDTFAKFGIQPDFVKFTDWKSGPNMFTQNGFTPEHRETMVELIDTIFSTITNGVRSNRKTLVSADESVFMDGPYTGQQGLDLKLVDKLAYKRDLLNWAVEQIPVDEAVSSKKADKEDDDLTQRQKIAKKRQKHLLPDTKYFFEESDSVEREKGNLALIFAAGQIVRGAPESPSPLARTSTENVYADQLSDAIYSAVDDKDTKVIVLRVDSPGGSYVASDTIRQAIIYAKSKEIPVIVSMGRLAASGGYFISMDADQIFAQPGTIAGSIGVYGGKFAVGELAKRYNVNFERIVKGDRATMLSATTPFSIEQRQALEENMRFVFKDFNDKAVNARPQLKTEVAGLLGGRIFGGEASQRYGLVDEIGGIHDAIKAAKVAAGLDADTLYPIVMYPKQKSPREAIKELLGGSINMPLLPLNTEMLLTLLESRLNRHAVNDNAELSVKPIF